MNRLVDKTDLVSEPKNDLMPNSEVVIDQEGCTLIRLVGHARMETAVLLHESLAKAPFAHSVMIEWEEAEHVDACVLQVLLAVRKALSARGLALTVRKDNPKVREYLNLSGLAEYFPAQPQSSESSTGAAHA